MTVAKSVAISGFDLIKTSISLLPRDFCFIFLQVTPTEEVRNLFHLYSSPV